MVKLEKQTKIKFYEINQDKYKVVNLKLINPPPTHTQMQSEANSAWCCGEKNKNKH
jgi:ribosomal protein L15E